ncbi:hypothetical protein [Kineococcus sp. SYSU DK004]|uniref:hypothetical protein n=1 Tax=Kineococcus sp. SYSU DK004 TaxID=3383125 RepID=UPI003D7E92DA
MARPAPKGALRKAPGREHPVAPAPSADSPTAPATATPAAAQAAAAPDPAVETAAPAAPAAALPMFSVRMDPVLRRRVKLWAAEHDMSVQALTAAALSEYLDRHSS